MRLTESSLESNTDPDVAVVDKGAASKKICRWAEEENVSMIAMTKTGAGLVKGLVMGATAQNVTLNSERSLLLLPADEVSND